MEPGRPVEARLSDPAFTLEQPTTWNTHLGSDASCHELGLVETATMAMLTTGGSPGDHIDLAGTDTGGQQPVDQQPGKVMGELPPIAVLESEQHIAGATGEGNRCDHLTTTRHRRWSGEREPAGSAQHRPDTFTPGTTRLEDHVSSSTRGV